MFNKYNPTIESIPNAVNIDMDAVYAHDALHVKDLIDGTPPKFTNKSIGVHWYGGNSIWGKFIKETNGGLTNLTDSVIGDLLRNIDY